MKRNEGENLAVKRNERWKPDLSYLQPISTIIPVHGYKDSHWDSILLLSRAEQYRCQFFTALRLQWTEIV